MDMLETLTSVKIAFLDTAPFIYYVEKNPRYAPIVQDIFDSIESGKFQAVTSPITLTECLVGVYKRNLMDLHASFQKVIVRGRNMRFVALNEAIADKTAEVRARYNLSLPDAVQLATALITDYDTLLTNDVIFRRVTELQIIVLDDYLPKA